jgi:hypothetical protein
VWSAVGRTEAGNDRDNFSGIEPWRTSASVTCAMAKIRTEYLSNTKVRCVTCELTCPILKCNLNCIFLHHIDYIKLKAVKFIHSFINGSTALCWALASSSVSYFFYIDGRTPWTSDQPVARPQPTHRTTQTQNKRIHTPNIHALSGIRTHDPNVRASEDGSYLSLRGHRDRQKLLNK